MIKYYTFIFLIFGGLLSTSCVPENKSSGRRIVGPDAQAGSVGEDEPPTPSFTGNVNWFSTGQSVSGNLLINENTSDVVFIRGEAIDNFLRKNGNENESFCLIASYNNNNPSAQRNLRALASPITFNNFSSGTVERLLKINIPNNVDNSNICTGNAYAFKLDENNASSTTDQVTAAQSAFSPPELCPDCGSIISSTRVDLYKVDSGGSGIVQFIGRDQLNLKSLGLRIDVQSNVSDPGGSCSNSECSAKGFDCCLDGQCVNDGVEKPNATQNSDYQVAMNDILENPSNYTNYPNIFYVCPTSTSPDDGSDDSDVIIDPDAQADESLVEQIEDFECIEEGKKNTPDFPSLGIDRCQDINEYIQVRNSVWDRCGCEATPFPSDPDEPACPDFGLKLKLNNDGDISQVQCLIPDTNVEPIPFQTLDLSVSNRTAPHRFYSKSGVNFDDVTKINDPTVEPEGERFFYLDESGKTQPNDQAGTEFSMNSILGQFSIDLSKARPAKVIPVELDRVYTIAARSGFYTPCPSCSTDSWFSAFTAHPASQLGKGLQATGHTTSRETYKNNITNGNYEDTIFGRACWVPPTMIPFTHRPNPDLNAQRRNRLQAQAALYVNGYQRDWFGFNKGALIGSFDGIKWFAIGKGRRVVADSEKLFLAINAPFADLAENTDTIVEVVADQSLDTVAESDYDFDLPQNDPRQNSGATCQSYHSCDVDSDCISKLGWEYACADVSRYKTTWPKFDINANEIVGEEESPANVRDFIQNFSQNQDQKRCVYRGAGSICKRDFNNSIDPLLKKQFSCAPNFYCASLGDNVFNDRLVRTPAILEQILFGQDADVLGRPEKYVRATNNLTNEIRINIQHNAELISGNLSDFGICRPGRSISNANYIDRHRTPDGQSRTDYISQIAGCSSSSPDASRIQSCPVIETRENRETPVGDIIRTDHPERLVRVQNMCGAESQKINNTGFVESSFKEIEADPISTIVDLLTPKMARDACMRRAGSICHTDLDCGPNRLHADQATFLGREGFGGSTAEKRFWEEALVCSQGEKTPLFGDEDFLSYDLTQNRCVREINQEITMYSQISALEFDPGIGQENVDLQVTQFAINNPRGTKRYSRYTTVPADISQVHTEKDVLGFNAPLVPFTNTSSEDYKKHFYQWRTINYTGKNSCSGGGFVRKFDDGTKDWGKITRLQLDPETFECLNYSNPLVLNRDLMAAGGGNVNNYDKEFDRLCRAPGDGGCVQIPIDRAEAFEIVPPTAVSPTAFSTINTTPREGVPACGGPHIQDLSTDVPYQPVVVPELSMRGPTGNCPDNFLFNDTFKNFISVFLPLYIVGPNALIDSLDFRVEYFDDQENSLGDFPLSRCAPGVQSNLQSESDAGTLNNNFIFNTVNFPENTWCTITHDGFDVLIARGEQGAVGGSWDYAGVKIPFTSASNHLAGIDGLNPGNDLYYLTKLARLELLGIPQIVHEPLYCNDDSSKLLEGIFDFQPQVKSVFEADARDFSTFTSAIRLQEIYDNETDSEPDNANPDGKFVYQDKISLPKVFSGHEFRCCRNLGKVVSTAGECCSGFALEDGNNDDQLTCRLPRRTNLNVYFNRFVSAEGIDPDLPLGGLSDEDFIPETGEPKLRRSTYDKIQALGIRFCQSNDTRRGSTTGFFFGEPNNGFFQQEAPTEDGRMYSIIDSARDGDGENDVGTIRFLEGFRWSHHIYCL
jgi:hypothetical protein